MGYYPNMNRELSSPAKIILLICAVGIAVLMMGVVGYVMWRSGSRSQFRSHCDNLSAIARRMGDQHYIMYQTRQAAFEDTGEIKDVKAAMTIGHHLPIWKMSIDDSVRDCSRAAAFLKNCVFLDRHDKEQLQDYLSEAKLHTQSADQLHTKVKERYVEALKD